MARDAGDDHQGAEDHESLTGAIRDVLLHRPSAGGDVTIIDLIGKLPVHPVKRYVERDLSKIQWFVLHHAAGPEDQTPDAIARYHVEHNDWPGIGYHFLVAVDGTAYKCWPQTTKSFCVAEGNTHALCICLIGNRSRVPCPPAQWEAAVELFRTLREAYPGRIIYGHKEVPTHPPQSTACPGALVDLLIFRAAVELPDVSAR